MNMLVLLSVCADKHRNMYVSVSFKNCILHFLGKVWHIFRGMVHEWKYDSSFYAYLHLNNWAKLIVLVIIFFVQMEWYLE